MILLANGFVTIGTKLDTSKFEEQLKKLETKYKNKSLEIMTTSKSLEKEKETLSALNREAEKLNQKYADMKDNLRKQEEIIKNSTFQKDGNITGIKQGQTDVYNKAKLAVSDLRSQMLKMLPEFEAINQKTEEQKVKVDSVNTKYQKQQNDLKQIQSEIDTTKGKMENIDRVSINTDNLFKKITRSAIKWAGAIIGVRSIYSGIRRAMSLVLSNNEQLSNQMQQMKNVLANALAPIVQNIIRLIAKLMVYINYIFHALTGKNLFNFSKATETASDNLKSGAKSAKEIRKELAGFDEMNVLGSNVGASGGAGGVDEFENIFDSMKDIKIPKWIETLANILKTLKKYWKEVALVIVAFGSAILALKIVNFIKDLLKLKNVTSKVSGGISLLVGGIVLLVGSIINLIMNWDNMTKQEKIITGFLAVVGAAFVALGYAIMNGISAGTLGIGLLIAAIVALVSAIGTQIFKESQLVKSIKDEKKQQEELTKAKEKAKKASDDLIDAIDRQTQAEKDLTQIQNETGLSGRELYKQVEEGNLTYKDMNETQREVYKAYKELKEATEEVTNAEKAKKDADSEVVAGNYNVQIANDKTGKSYDALKNDIIEAWKQGKISTKDAQDSISRMTSSMSEDARKTFTEDIPKDIKEGLNENKYRSTLDKLKDTFSTKFREIRDKVNSWLSGIKTSFNINANVQTGGGRHAAKGAVLYNPPKLAIGGIVNRPGRGIDYRGATIGEHGAEGVIPLTDSQQMALLGEAIGKYININATIPVYVGNRQIARELRKIDAEDEFARNS